MWVKRFLAEQYIIESAWGAQWLLEYVKSRPNARTPTSRLKQFAGYRS